MQRLSRRIAAAVLVAMLVIPAVPAAAAPTEGRVVSIFDLLTGWLLPGGSQADCVAAPSTASWTDPEPPASEEPLESPLEPSVQTQGEDTERHPMIDPNG